MPTVPHVTRPLVLPLPPARVAPPICRECKAYSCARPLANAITARQGNRRLLLRPHGPYAVTTSERNHRGRRGKEQTTWHRFDHENDSTAPGTHGSRWARPEAREKRPHVASNLPLTRQSGPQRGQRSTTVVQQADTFRERTPRRPTASNTTREFETASPQTFPTRGSRHETSHTEQATERDHWYVTKGPESRQQAAWPTKRAGAR